MTNREIINKLKDFGYEDTTETKYWTYPTYSGTMRQELQKEILDFTKKYGDNTITIGVENDRWSFNGLTDEDNVKENSNVWTNHEFDNEDLFSAGSIIDIEEEGDGLLFTIRKRNAQTRLVFRHQVKIGFDEYDED